MSGSEQAPKINNNNIVDRRDNIIYIQSELLQERYIEVWIEHTTFIYLVLCSPNKHTEATTLWIQHTTFIYFV